MLLSDHCVNLLLHVACEFAPAFATKAEFRRGNRSAYNPGASQADLRVTKAGLKHFTGLDWIGDYLPGHKVAPEILPLMHHVQTKQCSEGRRSGPAEHVEGRTKLQTGTSNSAARFEPNLGPELLLMKRRMPNLLP